MPAFLLTADYTPTSLKALLANPEANRGEMAMRVVEATGGKLIGYYNTVTNGSGIVIVYETPDPEAGIAIGEVFKSTGALENLKLARLFSHDEVKAYRTRAKVLEGTYQPPS